MAIQLVVIIMAALCFDFSQSKITSITDDTLDSYIPNQKCLILEIYSPRCQHCVKLAPIYEEVFTDVTANRSDILVAKMDGFDNRKISRFSVKGFTTVALFLPGNLTQHEEYWGELTKE